MSQAIKIFLLFTLNFIPIYVNHKEVRRKNCPNIKQQIWLSTIYCRVGAGAAGAGTASKFSPGAEAASK
jgi:hypothetical protein